MTTASMEESESPAFSRGRNVEGRGKTKVDRITRSKTPLRDFFRRDKSLSRKEEDPIAVSSVASSKPTETLANMGSATKLVESPKPSENPSMKSEIKLVESPSDILRRSPFRLKKNTIKGQNKTTASPKSVIASAQEEEKTCTYDIDPTILYKLIEFRAWEETIDRIDQKPVEVETWVARYDDGKKLRWRMLPLHAAILFRAPIRVIQALIKSFPEATQMYDDRHMFPIHIACSVVAEADVVQCLIDSFPPSLYELDYKGRNADEILLEAGKRQSLTNAPEGKVHKEVDTLRELLRKESERYDKTKGSILDTADIEDNAEDERSDEVEDEEHESNNTPDSALMEYDYDKFPTLLVKLLEEKRWDEAVTRCKNYPREAATWMCRFHESPATHGSKNSEKVLRWKILPIHSAVVLNAPLAVIKTIVETYPAGAYQGDDRGMLPIHMAFRLAADLDICKALVKAYSKSLHHPDKSGVTPLQILKGYRREYRKSKNVGNKTSSASDLKRKALFQHFLGQEEAKDGVLRDKIASPPRTKSVHQRSHSDSPKTISIKKVNHYPLKNGRKGVSGLQSNLASPIESLLNEMNPGRCYAPKDLLLDSDSRMEYSDDDSTNDSSIDDDHYDDDYSSRVSSIRDPDALFYDGIFQDIGRLTIGSVADLFLCGSGRKR